MRRLVRAYLPAALWAGVLIFLGGQSDLQGPVVSLPLDKLAHFFLYGILGGLAGRAWERAGRWPAWGWPLLFVLLVAAADELHQRTVPGRSAEFADWLADATGAILAFAGVSRWVARRGKTKDKA